MGPVELTLYSRPGCHLCDDMKAIVAPVARELGCTVREVDISGQPELESRFGQEIPVLFIGERKAFKYRLTEPALRRRLRARREYTRPA